VRVIYYNKCWFSGAPHNAVHHPSAELNRVRDRLYDLERKCILDIIICCGVEHHSATVPGHVCFYTPWHCSAFKRRMKFATREVRAWIRRRRVAALDAATGYRFPSVLVNLIVSYL
jgi:hypothetical protein